jgi:hypothetical protein
MRMQRPRLLRNTSRLRPLVMLTGIVVTLLLIVLTPPTPSYACTCAQVTPQVAFASAQGVLIGTLTEVDEPPAWPRFTPYSPFVYFAPAPGVPAVWTIAVDRVWKGPDTAMIQVRTASPATSMCADYVMVGTEYLIYAMQDGEGLRRDICQRLVERGNAADDLAQLGPATLPRLVPALLPAAPEPWPIVGVVMLLLTMALIVWRQRRRPSS